VRERASSVRAWQWVVVATVSLALLLSYWLVLLIPAGRTAFVEGRGALRLTAVLTTAGAGGVVLVAWHCRPVVRAFEHRITQWLGSRSYSLYLVHEPIIVAVGFAFGGFRLVLVPVGLGLSLVVAEAFYRVAEHPSIGLSRRVGRWTAAGIAQRADLQAG
jgi:peptidoglycan/LPS O-acetylase OafA/YrhL